jgi:tRNA pseudouridine55 synthase
VTDGLILVDKEPDMTSHDVVARVRRIAHTRRVGHAGTLDPMATGVLVLGVEKATRLLRHLTLTDKTYRATIRLGQSTTTDDREGEIIGGASAAAISEAAIDAAMAGLRGDIMQVPSAVSAIKVNGERAYKLVRDGAQVELAARPVTVSRFDIDAPMTRPAPDLLDLDVVVECSSGTYVRALARDLGDQLGVGGHLTALRRTRVGPFDEVDAFTLDHLALQVEPVTIPLSEAVRTSMPAREISEDEARALSYGQTIEVAGIAGTYGAFAPDGAVIALLIDADGAARPEVVFAPAG